MSNFLNPYCTIVQFLPYCEKDFWKNELSNWVEEHRKLTPQWAPFFMGIYSTYVCVCVYSTNTKKVISCMRYWESHSSTYSVFIIIVLYDSYMKENTLLAVNQTSRLKYCDQCLILQPIFWVGIFKSISEFRIWIPIGVPYVCIALKMEKYNTAIKNVCTITKRFTRSITSSSQWVFLKIFFFILQILIKITKKNCFSQTANNAKTTFFRILHNCFL